VVSCWHVYLPEVRLKWFAYVPADGTAIQSSVALLKPRMGYFFGASLVLTHALLEKRPLNELL